MTQQDTMALPSERMARILEDLAQPLDPRLIKERPGPGRRRFRYISGNTVISQANRIFGHDGWGMELVEISPCIDYDYDVFDSNSGEIRRMRLGRAYTATVKVTVKGFPPRTATAFQRVADETLEGHETAIKGAETDALKRAFRTFGAQFANDLYEDDGPSAPPGRNNGQVQQDVPAPDPEADKLRRELLDLVKEKGQEAAWVQSNAERKYKAPWGAISQPQLKELLEKIREMPVKGTDAPQEPPTQTTPTADGSQTPHPNGSDPQDVPSHPDEEVQREWDALLATMASLGHDAGKTLANVLSKTEKDFAALTVEDLEPLHAKAKERLPEGPPAG